MITVLLKKAKTILCNDKYKDDISNKSTVNTNNTNDEDSSIWRKLGFQTGNPRTDFRAGGFFSLEFMNYFANNHEKEFTNMINEDYFTYALVCIRLCYLMRVYLFLLPQDEIQINITGWFYIHYELHIELKEEYTHIYITYKGK